jgi:hypothetical protein
LFLTLNASSWVMSTESLYRLVRLTKHYDHDC